MVIRVYVNIYIFVIYMYDLSVKLTLSACVWRWSCTRYREQMLLMQVAQVKLSRGEGSNLGNFLCLFISFENSCKPWWVIVWHCSFSFWNGWLWTLLVHLINYKFSRVLGKWGIIKCAVFNYFFFYFFYKSVISWRDVTNNIWLTLQPIKKLLYVEIFIIYLM